MKSKILFDRNVTCREWTYHYLLKQEEDQLFLEGTACFEGQEESRYRSSALPYRDRVCLEVLTLLADTFTHPSFFYELITEAIDFEWKKV
jgi:hypothetical protein